MTTFVTSRHPARIVLTFCVAAGLLMMTTAPAPAAIWTVSSSVTAANTPVTEGAAVEQALVEAKITSSLTSLLASGELQGATSIKVIDVASGTSIFAHNQDVARTAASNTKLYTAVAALESVGPKTTFATTIKRSGTSKRVTFVSGGDPRMTNGKLRSLARQTATQLKARGVKRTAGKKVVLVRLDDTVFSGPSKHSTWRHGGYGLGTIQPVRGTARVSVRSSDSAASAAHAYGRYLSAALGKGWKVKYSGRATAPTSSKSVATVASATVESLVKRVLNVSDNQVAEVLQRHIALSQGEAPTFAGGAKATLRVVKKLGVTTAKIKLVDGSGLSPQDRITPTSLTSLLTVAANPAHTRLRSILYEDSSLPVAGKTGTLKSAYGRFAGNKSKCAVGKVVAKTGSLDYEVALSGYTVGADGRLKAFSVLVNGLRGSAAKAKARGSMDRVAATVNGCT